MLHGNTRWMLCLQLTLVALVAAPMMSGQVLGPNPSSSPANVSYTIHDPVTEQMTNTCNGEVVDLAGELVYAYHQETKPNGDQHIVIDATTNLTGTGETTGAKYNSKDRVHSDFKVDPAVNINQQATQNYTETDKLKLVAQGPTPDLTTVHILHWRITRDGILVWRDHPSISRCSH